MPGGFSKFWMVVLCLCFGAVAGVRAQFGDITDQPSDFMGLFDLPSLAWENLGALPDLPWDTEISLRHGYDSNVYTTNVDPIGSFNTNGALGILYKFGSPRLQLELDVTGGATYYYTRPGDKIDYSFDLLGAATFQASPRLFFTLNVRVAYLSQPDFLIPGTDAQRTGDYWYNTYELGMTYIIQPRLSTSTRYTYSALTYVDPDRNAANGLIDQTISQSFSFLLVPTTSLVSEFRVNPITYYEADLNTTGVFLIFGFDHRFNQRTTWTFRAGAEGRYDENPSGNGFYLGPYLSTVFSYQASERTSLNWNMHYGTEPSGLGDVTIRQTFRTGLGLSYGFTRRLTATCDVYYQHNFYDQPGVIADFTEQIFAGSLGLRFEVTRNVSLETVYQYTQDVAPDAPSLEYTRNVIYAGINFLF